MKHKYLLVRLARRMDTSETATLSRAIMEFEKVIGVTAIYDYQIKKRTPYAK